MDNEFTVIPKLFRTYYDVKADLDTLTGLKDGELAFATDENTLYRQDGNGAANWVATTFPLQYQAGDNLIMFGDVQGTNPPLAYTLKKEIRIQFGGTLRIKMDLMGWNAGTGIYGRVYRNGVAVGTENDGSNDLTWLTVSEDIAGWQPDDLCQLYVRYRGAASANSKWRNFRIYALHTYLVSNLILDI